jgi:hypothetical protein
MLIGREKQAPRAKNWGRGGESGAGTIGSKNIENKYKKTLAFVFLLE